MHKGGTDRGGTARGRRGDLPPGRARRKGGAHPAGEGEAGQRLPSLHPGTGSWVRAAPQRAALVGLRGERYGGVSPRRVAEGVEGRQTKNAPQYKAKAAGGTGCGSACMCRGEATDAPLCPLFGEKPKNTCLSQGGQGAAEVGQAPPALQETPVAQWRVALSVRPTPSHPEDAPSCPDGGTAAGCLQQEDAFP